MKPLITERPTPSRIPVLLSVITLLQIVLLISSLLQWLVVARLANKTDAYEQADTGDVYQLTRIDSAGRTPEMIQAFALKALMLLFSWPGPQPNHLGQIEPDKGLQVDIGDDTFRVPEQVVASSFLLEPGLQEAMLKRIAEVVPTDYFGGDVEVLLTIDEITLPKKTKVSGEYEVTVVGNRYTIRERTLPGSRKPFNKIITLRTTTAPVHPVGDTPIARKVYGVRQAGLLITNIRDISLEEQQ